MTTTPDFVYLDYAAATPVADFVSAAMQPYSSELFFNPSSPYFPAVETRRAYEAAKQKLAQSFGAKGDEIVMTAGATESINLAFSHIRGRVVTSSIEHPAVLETAKRHEHTLVAPNERGIVEPDKIKAVLGPDTEVVSISLANSELGTIQPLRKIAAVLHDERQKRTREGNRTPLLFHSDASQGFGLIDLHVSRLGVDLLTLNAAKIYGPKQVGLLWANPSVRLEPVVSGGGQERGLRSGTENVAGTIGFAEAAKWASNHQKGEAERLKKLRDTLEERLVEEAGAVVLGSSKHRLPNYVSVSFPGLDAERLIFLLETKGVYVATGSACSANKHTASHVLVALGLDDDIISGSLRLTLGRQTDTDKVERAVAEITFAVRSERERTTK